MQEAKNKGITSVDFGPGTQAGPVTVSVKRIPMEVSSIQSSGRDVFVNGTLNEGKERSIRIDGINESFYPTLVSGIQKTLGSI